MTCGIYKLSFIGTDKVYIGQSINIEARYIGHKYKLTSDKHTRKLTDAYNMYGMPILEILIECTKEDLDVEEKECIEVWNSIDNGFNDVLYSGAGCSIHGENHGNSKYTNEQVISTFLLLVNKPELHFDEIKSITKVSYALVAEISKCKNHKWLKEMYPTEYSKLESLKGNRKSIGISGKNFILKSPDGVLYTILNIRAFSREHNLCQSHISKVLRGTAKTHKGWRLAT